MKNRTTLVGLIIILIITISLSYYVNKEGFEDSNAQIIVNAVDSRTIPATSTLPPTVDIYAHTTHGGTYSNTNILYNSTKPKLTIGDSTDSMLGSISEINAKDNIVYSASLDKFKDGYTYYIVTQNLKTYTEGTTLLLGSFVYNASTTQTSVIPTPTSVIPTPTTYIRVIARTVKNKTSNVKQLGADMVDIYGYTTDNTVIKDAKILYNSTMPKLSSGDQTDSTLVDVIPSISGEETIIYNVPLKSLKDGYTYYIVESNVKRYKMGNPFLGSFVYKDSGNGDNCDDDSWDGDNRWSITASDSSIPQRTDITPDISVSESTRKAKELNKRSGLLKDIQKVVRNELMVSRNTTPVVSGQESAMTTSMTQGQEYENNCYKGTENRCPKNPDGTCPPIPDMSNYIKKDGIPCWGCNIDY